MSTFEYIFKVHLIRLTQGLVCAYIDMLEIPSIYCGINFATFSIGDEKILSIFDMYVCMFM